VILRLFTEGERLAEPISLSKQRKTIKGKSDSRDFLQQLDTHNILSSFDSSIIIRYNVKDQRDHLVFSNP
ncbi:hypothetical protein, partial [Marinilactibacillus psychrotolerans]|uniref:hypothetical protein n=1 Tax=Marinilactibacillus psychrotolerans TaxID=191770 RepID=UPI001C7CFA24